LLNWLRFSLIRGPLRSAFDAFLKAG
jgi:hypothetical protein